VATGFAALAAGVAAVAALPAQPELRLVGALLWAAMGGRDLWLVAARNMRFTSYRIDSQGIVQIRAADGCCITATLCSGSIVLRRAAWLRIRVGNARPHCELIRRDAAENKHWRRLQVIWRHLGARS
jgi:hypothetical protein